jgi:hypothetical protein
MAVYAKVVENRSFSAAGAKLGLGRSVISQHIRSLEDRLGVRLINRNTRSFSLTDEGERLFHFALVLDPEARKVFLQLAKSFPLRSDYTFSDYQQLAYKTARTDGRILLEVCIAVIWQLGAELLRPTLPEVEITLNRNIADRPTNVVLGEIAWHLSAMASLYSLSLDDVVAANCQKVNYRSERGAPTPLHDADREPKEQFPRSFDVSFVRIGGGRSRMYVNGRPLGDDLTDNAYEDDGYRFHDVIHLALIAHLGWSPVFRGLMKRKRKSNSRVDEVEDGARAKLVEELVIKAIHSEGDRQAKAAGRCAIGKPTRLFPDRSHVNFKLLKALRTYVDGLEVAKNTFWEWEDAIVEGFDMFYRLCNETQGTVRVDLDARKLTFSPTVCPKIQGITAGFGMGSADVWPNNVDEVLSAGEREWASERNLIAETVAAKRAILDACGLDKDLRQLWAEIEVRLDVGNRVYVKTFKSVQQRAWALRAVDYKVAFGRGSSEVICTATSIADVADVLD